MSYALLADILKALDEDVLIQLTDDDDTGSVDEAVVQSALDDATALIDGYVGCRYALPLATEFPLLKRFNADLAVCSLYDRRLGRPERWQERYKTAIAFLGKVAEGKIRLGADDPAGTGPSDVMTTAANPALFPRQELDRY